MAEFAQAQRGPHMHCGAWVSGLRTGKNTIHQIFTLKTFISCYRTPGPQKGFRRVSEGVSGGDSEGFSKGFRRVLEGVN